MIKLISNIFMKNKKQRNKKKIKIMKIKILINNKK